MKLAVLFICSIGCSALQFAHVYNDSMVLQREPLQASVWGWADPGEKVTVAIKATADGATMGETSVTASVEGKWRVSLPAQPASTAPVMIVATAGSATAQLEDVLFGDGKSASFVAFNLLFEPISLLV
jgi:sialate O-acetylesterase